MKFSKLIVMSLAALTITAHAQVNKQGTGPGNNIRKAQTVYSESNRAGVAEFSDKKIDISNSYNWKPKMIKLSLKETFPGIQGVEGEMFVHFDYNGEIHGEKGIYVNGVTVGLNSLKQSHFVDVTMTAEMIGNMVKTPSMVNSKQISVVMTSKSPFKHVSHSRLIIVDADGKVDIK